MSTRIRIRLPLIFMSVLLVGCVTMKKDHEALVSEVDELQRRVEARDQELEETLKRADAQMQDVQVKLDEAARLLRANQANLGARVENLEGDVAESRGLAEDSQNELAAMTQSLREMRAELELRLQKLEAAVNAVTNIPEGKQELLSEAERLFKASDFQGARRLFRIYVSRYSEASDIAVVRFKIGLTLFNERDNRAALGEFYWVVRNGQKSPAIHDALYYSGLAFARLGACKQSLAYFEALTRKGSEAPERYKKQALKQIEILKEDKGEICQDEKSSKDSPASPKTVEPKQNAPAAGSKTQK